MPNVAESDWGGVILMIYGTARVPRGPRSALSVWLMRSAEIDFRLVDVTAETCLRAEAVRRSGMELFPQIYVDGEFVGNGEVIAELRRSGFFDIIARRPFDRFHGLDGD
jgi:monothiol glutaredoxin